MTGGLSRMDLSVPGATPGKLASIDQWGDIRWDSMERAFHGASNMEYNAADSPDLSRVTDMRDMFYEASSFNGNLSSWDVSSVNRMDYMFYTASSFNGNLSSWDVSSVNRMDGMFSHASSFNGNLSSWDVSSVNRMEHMFSRATDFNGNISSWNASSVNRMDYMFSGASSFNGSLSGWDVSSVTDMTGTFSQASDFNQPLDDWNVSSVTRMDHMFNDAPFFNGNLPSWDVSSVNRMDNMFSGASDFNGSISSWNVSSVTRMDSMFSGASDFNGNVSSWNVSSVTRMNGMFSGASSFNGSISSWNVSSVISMSGMFNNASSFDQNLGKWYVVLNSTATDGPGIVGGMSAQNAFLNAHNSTYGIGTGPDSDHFEITGGNLLNLTSVDPGQDAYTANVTASGDDVFESGNNWRLLEVTASSPNLAPTVRAGPDLVLAEGAEFALGGSATDPNGDDLTYSWSQDPESPAVAFSNASSPVAAITLPQVEEDATVTLTLTASDTSSASASDSLTLSIRETGSAFLTTWSVTGTGTTVSIPTEGSYGIVWGDGRADTVTGTGTQSHTYPAAGEYQVAMTGGLSRMDLSASGATPGKLASIDQWGGIGWTSMEGAFQEASSMEYGAADAPDLSGVTNMGHMFEAASSFNGNISGWDVSSVTDMNSMFIEAPSFNQSLNAWDVSSVTDMNSMFAEANSFNGNISGWDVSSVTLMDGMFHNAPFNQPLNAWNVSSVTGMTFMFSGTTFNQNISAWDVSSATGMDGMFSGASSFNQPLNAWNVSSATGMGHMFSGASSFNGNVSSWDVSSATGMDGMFEGASSFNGNVSAWDVSKVGTMTDMFSGASSFDQNLGSWYVVPADTAYDASEGTLNVTTVSAQNAFLDGHEPEYGIGAGGNPTLFNMTGGALMFEAAPDAGQYSVNITASGDDVFGTGNHRVYNVTVTGAPIGVTDGTPPEILAARATARNAIAVTFSEDVDADSTDGSGWSITGNDAGTLTVQSNTDPAGSSSTMNLTLSGNLPDTAPDLRLAYAAPATGGITDTASPANPLGSQTVEVGDGIPPVVESARATSPTGITLTMSEIVNSSGTGPNGFAVSTTGTAVTVSSIGGSNSDTLVLTLSGSISDADTITVSYGTGDVRDLASNPLAGFSGRTVDTSTDITPPTFVSATYSTGNGSLAITFSEPIGGTANLSQLHVRESGQSSGGATLTGASQSVSGSTLTVALTAAQQTTLAGLTTPQLDIDAGAVSDANANGIDASADNAITVDDTTPPTFVSATYSTGSGLLAITFSEPIGGTANLSQLHVRESGQSSGGATLTGASQSVSGSTLTVALTAAQQTTLAGLATPQLDIDAGAVSDANSNGIDASADNAITVDDTTKPTFVSATYSTGNGSLVITFSEPIGGTANLSQLHVRESGQSSGGATLTGASQSVSGSTLTVALTAAQQTTLAGLATPQLDIDAGAVSDANGNGIDASADNAITVDDTTKPTFVSATYSTGNGLLAITFSEPIGGTANLSQLHVRESGQSSGGATLTGASQSVSGSTLTVALTAAQQTTLAGLTTPQLDIDAGAVSDANGNGIDASADRAITVDDTVPPTVQSARATAANTIVVTFSENVDAGAVNGAGWSLSGADAGNLTVTSNTDPGGSSDALTLTLSGSLQDTAPDLILTYAVPASGGITDTANPANPLGSQTVEVGDGIPPAVESARATSPTGITLTMSEIVNSSGTGPNGFAVSTTGTAVTVSSIGGSNSDTLVLTLSGSISDADTITVSYGTGDVRDLASNPLAGFSGRTVDTSTDITPPTVKSATLDSETGVLVITFSETVDTSSVEPARLFINGSGWAGRVQLTGAVVTTASDSAAVSINLTGQQLGSVSEPAPSLSLDVGAGAVSDTAGNPIAESPGNLLTRGDRTGPAPTITTAATSPTNLDTIEFAVDFGEPIDAGTFGPEDILAQGGTASSPLSADGQGKNFTFTVGGIAEGRLTVGIPEGAVKDLAGNNSTESNPIVIDVDQTPPYIVAAYVIPPGAVSLTYSEAVGVGTLDGTGFALSGGGDVTANTDPGLGSGIITLTVTGAAAGNVTYDEGAGTVADRAGNGAKTDAVPLIDITDEAVIVPIGIPRYEAPPGVSTAGAPPGGLPPVIIAHGPLSLNFSQVLVSNGTANSARLSDSAVNLTATVGGVRITVSLPANTTATGDSSWDGLFSLPAPSGAAPPAPGQSTVHTKRVTFSVGADTTLHVDRAVRILVPGEGGRNVFFSGPDGAPRAVPECVFGDSQEGADAGLTAGGDCHIDVGRDLAIWTRHLSHWGTYHAGPRVIEQEPETESEAPADDTATAAGGSGSGSRGGGGGGSGGGGGGGAPAAIITDVRIYSVSWDCAAGSVAVTAGPDTDQLSVNIRTSSVGERPVVRAGGELPGTRSFTSAIAGADEFAVVEASLAYEGDQVITKIVNMGQCTGTAVFDRYEPPQTALRPEPEPRELCRDGREPALRDGNELLCLFPGTFEVLAERGWNLARP